MQETKKQEQISLKIGTFNIKHGGKLGNNCQEISKIIVGEKLDIVGLQEIDRYIARSGNQNIIETIAKYAKYPYYGFYKSINYANGEYGLGVLSKYPIKLVNIIKLSHSIEQRILVNLSININNKELAFFISHLELGFYEDVRQYQLKTLAKEVTKYEEFILVGDFNNQDWNKVDSSFELSYHFSQYQVLNNPNNCFYTYHSDYDASDIAPIDNIILSNNFIVNDVYMVNTKYSDHNLFVAKLYWNK